MAGEGKKNKGRFELESVGFKVVRSLNFRWFEVLCPEDGEEGVMLRQAGNCWHFFAKNVEATASGIDPLSALRGGLGDAIGTDAELRTYKRLLRNPPEKILTVYAALYRASSQVYNEDRVTP